MAHRLPTGAHTATAGGLRCSLRLCEGWLLQCRRRTCADSLRARRVRYSLPPRGDSATLAASTLDNAKRPAGRRRLYCVIMAAARWLLCAALLLTSMGAGTVTPNPLAPPSHRPQTVPDSRNAANWPSRHPNRRGPQQWSGAGSARWPPSLSASPGWASHMTTVRSHLRLRTSPPTRCSHRFAALTHGGGAQAAVSGACSRRGSCGSGRRWASWRCCARRAWPCTTRCSTRGSAVLPPPSRLPCCLPLTNRLAPADWLPRRSHPLPRLLQVRYG